MTGWKLYNFDVCPHHKENIQFIFSKAIDGNIKAWLFDNMGSRVDYEAPGRWCTTMLYNADWSSKEGDSHLVEWNESEGAIKRTYVGFGNNSHGVVQFDTTQNRLLTAGEDKIKFWDMDHLNVLASTDASGGLLSLPRLRFNKEWNLLVVTTTEKGIKILANTLGLKSLKAIESRSFESLRSLIEPDNLRFIF